MLLNIIEDCSPFYIRFESTGIENLLSYMNEQTPSASYFHKNKIIDNGYFTEIYNNTVTTEFYKIFPINQDITFDPDHVIAIRTQPGGGGPVHKDIDYYDNYSSWTINIGWKILDDKCVTSWYNDEAFKDYPQTDGKYRRTYSDYRSIHNRFPALKTLTARQSELVLINSDIWHAWDNSLSTNYRSIIGIRPHDSVNFSYHKARKILFDF